MRPSTILGRSRNISSGRRPTRTLADRAGWADMEALEKREFLALTNVLIAEYPRGAYDATGVTTYNAATQAFDVVASPTSVRTSASMPPVPVAGGHGDFQIHIRVNAAGQFIGGVPGDDLVIQGSADLDGNGTIDPGESGVLLTGEAFAFGSLDSGGPTDTYDFRFIPTGGLLLASYPAGRDIGLTMTSENSTFAGDFSVNFTGGAKGSYAPIERAAPASLSGFVYVDGNNNGDIDFGEAGIPGVTVTLTGVDLYGNSVTRTAATDANGAYSFNDLRAGTYRIVETQPASYVDGIDTLGTLGGVTANDVFSSIQVLAGQDGFNYNFGERLQSSTPITTGDTATIGFWHNKNGQALIKSLNGGATSTALGNWLATNFPNMYGAQSGSKNLSGKTNTQVAAAFMDRFTVKGQKLDAQVLAVAFAVYVTNSGLAGGSMASGYGFNVSATGTGARTFNVGSSGAAFGVANNSTLTVMQLLQATNSLSTAGNIYNFDTALRNLANTVYDSINNTGDII